MGGTEYLITRELVDRLHARQEWDVFSPIRVGEALQRVGHYRSLRKARSRICRQVKEVIVFRPIGTACVTQPHASKLYAVGRAKTARYGNRPQPRESSGTSVFKIGERDGERIETPSRKVTDAMCMALSGPRLNYHNNREKAVKRLDGPSPHYTSDGNGVKQMSSFDTLTMSTFDADKRIKFVKRRA